MGTMLLGSFVMAVIHFIKVILEYIRSMKSDNTLLNILAAIAMCIISCCQAFWDMLSTNAYYLVGMFGIPFCDALNLGLELTSLGVTTLFYVVGNIMVNVGVFLVTVGSTAITLWIVDFDLDAKDSALQLLLAVLMSLMISSIIMTVYSVS